MKILLLISLGGVLVSGCMAGGPYNVRGYGGVPAYVSPSSGSRGGLAAGIQSGLGLFSGVTPRRSVQPTSGYKYDPKTGNSYRYNTDSLGNTYVRGSNYTTGSSWSSTINKNGNQRGYDSKMNAWTYNAASGNYYNYGTGKSCYGKGAFRTCY